MPTLSREEVENKFPLAIRDIGNLILGKRYKKVYSICAGDLNKFYGDEGVLIKVWLAKTLDGPKWKYQLLCDYDKLYEDFCAEAGITPYNDDKWNSSNYLMEIMPTEYEEYDVTATYDNCVDEPYEEFVGSLSLRKIITPQDYPAKLEFDGVTYYPQL